MKKSNSLRCVNARNCLLLLVLFFSLLSSAQPNYLSKQSNQGVEVYQDLVKPYIYYYAPAKLSLMADDNGKPSFQFLKMRYTGSNCYSDEGEHHFTNLIQLTVKMESYESDILKSISKSLKKTRSIILKPLPVSHIESQLVLPLIQKDGIKKDQKLGEKRSLESTNEAGLSGRKSFWDSRTFTVKLDNHSANILTEQLKMKQLSISFDYSFYTHMNIKSSSGLELTGSRELINAVNNNLDSIQEYQKSILVRSDAFQIDIDLDKFPETVKEVDLNESIPPTYAAVEVRCYDFSENLRPDLYLKIVEVAAQSVDGSQEVIMSTKFHKKHSDINRKRIHFPYAIDMDASMKYRITEISNKGEEKVFDWKNKEECSELIDVTTPISDIQLISYSIEIEVDASVFDDEDIESIAADITYLLHEKIQIQELTFKPSDSDYIQNSTFYYDKNSSVKYQITKKISDGSVQKSIPVELNHGYIFISEKIFDSK